MRKLSFLLLIFLVLPSLLWADSGDSVIEGKSITGKLEAGGGTLEIPNSTSLPATCVVGDVSMDTDATTGQRLYLCESADTWVLQGDGSGPIDKIIEGDTSVEVIDTGDGYIVFTEDGAAVGRFSGGNFAIGTSNLIAKLTVEGVLGLDEVTAPSATAGYGKFYVKATDSLAYFKDDGGNEYDLTDDVPDAGDFGAATDLDANGALNTGCVAGNELASTAVVAGVYTNTDLTVDADGRITAAASGSSVPAGSQGDMLFRGASGWLAGETVFNVKSYGAIGNGTTDDTTAIQNTINAAQGGDSKGVVYFPPGTYKVTSMITITGSYITLRGERGASYITRTNGGSYHSFYFAPTDTVNSQIYEACMEDLKIQCITVAPTGGSLVRFKSVHGFSLENIYLQDGFNNLQIIGSGGGRITNFHSYYGSLLGSETATTYHVYIDKGDHAIVPTTAETYFDVFELSGSTDYYVQVGIVIKSADGIWFSNGHIFRTYANAVYIDPATNQHITGLFFNHVYFDGCGKTNHTGNEVQFASTSTAAYTDFNFDSCNFGGNSTRGRIGFYVGTASPKNISITNCTIAGYYSHGIQFNGAITEFNIQSNRIFNNNGGNSGASGISILDGCSDFAIQNNQIGRISDSPDMATGISAGGSAGCEDFIITGNLIKGCTTAIAYPSPLRELVADNNTS